MASAAEVCSRFDLKPEAKNCLQAGMRCREFVGALVIGKQYVSAIDFLAHLLPIRESVWWGCLCLQHACGGDYSDVDKAACRAAVDWIMRPEEDVRGAAKVPAEAAGPGSAAGSLALAVYQTGNIAPPQAPPMPPAPYAASKAVARAVKLASTKAGASNLIETQRAYVFLAAKMAQERSWFDS